MQMEEEGATVEDSNNSRLDPRRRELPEYRALLSIAGRKYSADRINGPWFCQTQFEYVSD